MLGAGGARLRLTLFPGSGLGTHIPEAVLRLPVSRFQLRSVKHCFAAMCNQAAAGDEKKIPADCIRPADRARSVRRLHPLFRQERFRILRFAAGLGTAPAVVFLGDRPADPMCH